MKHLLILFIISSAIVLLPAMADDSTCGGVILNSNNGRLNIKMEPPQIPEEMTTWSGKAEVYTTKLVVKDGRKKYVKEYPGDPVKIGEYKPGMDSDSWKFEEGTVLIVEAEIWVHTETGTYKFPYKGIIKVSGKDNN